MNITKEEFEAYEKVRKSGVTNMYYTQVVSEMSGLDKEQIMEIMKTYDKLCKKYPGVRE